MIVRGSSATNTPGLHAHAVAYRLNKTGHFVTGLPSRDIAKHATIHMEVGTADADVGSGQPDPPGCHLWYSALDDVKVPWGTVDCGFHA